MVTNYLMGAPVIEKYEHNENQLFTNVHMSIVFIINEVNIVKDSRNYVNSKCSFVC